MFKKAERKKAKLRLGIIGPAGSGKTYSALLIAKGLGGKIAMIDTENGSGELYSHLVNYDVATITSPFIPQKYINTIKEAEKAGYNILIIDSLSHAWQGEGGILDMHDKATAVIRNSFMAWREVTPQHNALVDAILQSPLHIIATMRTKTAYEVINEGGKVKVTKVGLAPIQREGMEYEFTTVFELSVDGHVATATKDRTTLFDGKYFTPTIETGKELLGWLENKAEFDEKTRFQEITNKLNTAKNMEELKTIWNSFSEEIKCFSPQYKEQITQLKDTLKVLIDNKK